MSTPNLKEIEWAISELENKESSEAGYSLLAALYTCRNEMMGLPAPQPQIAPYSEASSPSKRLARYGDSDFLTAIDGKDPCAVWAVMDELMDTLRAVNRRVYDSVMRKLERL